MDGPKAQVMRMLQERKVVRSREFIRELSGWDFRKCISRLIREGKPIKNIAKGNSEGIYVWTDGEQGRML